MCQDKAPIPFKIWLKLRRDLVQKVNKFVAEIEPQPLQIGIAKIITCIWQMHRQLFQHPITVAWTELKLGMEIKTIRKFSVAKLKKKRKTNSLLFQTNPRGRFKREIKQRRIKNLWAKTKKNPKIYRKSYKILTFHHMHSTSSRRWKIRRVSNKNWLETFQVNRTGKFSIVL